MLEGVEKHSFWKLYDYRGAGRNNEWFSGSVINVYLQNNIDSRGIKEIPNVETKLVFHG